MLEEWDKYMKDKYKKVCIITPSPIIVVVLQVNCVGTWRWEIGAGRVFQVQFDPGRGSTFAEAITSWARIRGVYAFLNIL